MIGKRFVRAIKKRTSGDFADVCIPQVLYLKWRSEGKTLICWEYNEQLDQAILKPM